MLNMDTKKQAQILFFGHIKNLFFLVYKYVFCFGTDDDDGNLYPCVYPKSWSKVEVSNQHMFSRESNLFQVIVMFSWNGTFISYL